MSSKGSNLSNFSRIFILNIAIITLSLAFQNCAKVTVSDLPSVSAVTESSIKLNVDCATARSQGKLQTQTLTMDFANPNQQCSWGSSQVAADPSANLSQLDGIVTARNEQLNTLPIIKNATVCNIQMTDTKEQNFWYDDNIILTLNGYVMASSTNFSAYFQKNQGFDLYNWASLRGKPAQNYYLDSTSDKQYCAGLSEGISTCDIPQTDSWGALKINIGEPIIQGILSLTDPSQVSLGIISLGDNDSTDCQHVPLRFEIKVEYFTK
jgi:hypothetical protein